MRRRVHADLAPAVERHNISRPHTGDGDVERRANHPLVDRHDLAEARGRIVRRIDRTSSVTMQEPLAAVERHADAMIEMRVRDEDVRYADESLGTSPDIEPDIQVSDAEPCLLPGPRTTLDRETARAEGEVVVVDRP